MSQKTLQTKPRPADDLEVIDAEIAVSEDKDLQGSTIYHPTSTSYILLPLIFLAVTFLGGLRFAEADNAFLFIKPALICLVFASVILVLYIRAHLIDIGGWFSHSSTGVQNAANAAILLTLFTASVQLFNSLIPEQGLPMWVVGFCFIWTLWNNLFSEFDTKRLLKSLAALFGMAFVVKYLVLANLTAPTGDGWLQRIFNNPGREAFTWLLDLPRYSAATGYAQFFTLALYLIGLYLTPRSLTK
ncbi:MAG: hypothetical protein JO053_13435 [Acidobacteria bacterium]|nr:hypothetical protein [Acidobacteriota bacterium]